MDFAVLGLIPEIKFREKYCSAKTAKLNPRENFFESMALCLRAIREIKYPCHLYPRVGKYRMGSQ